MSHSTRGRKTVKDRILQALTERPMTPKELASKIGGDRGHIVRTLGSMRGLVVNVGKGWCLAAPAITKFQTRLHQNEDLKREIGRLVVDFALGGLRNDSDLWGQLGSARQDLLESVCASHERTLILDGGSTNCYVAEALKEVSFPYNKYNVWRLLVITNCPSIAECLAERSDGCEVALLGGRVTRDTRSISGHLAERTLSEWSIKADFACIGATGVDPHRGFCSFSESESVIKLMKLDRASIRCIAMDSTKAPREDGKSRGPEQGLTFAFLPLRGDALHFLITDSKIWEKKEFCYRMMAADIQILARRPPQDDPVSAPPSD